MHRIHSLLAVAGLLVIGALLRGEPPQSYLLRYRFHAGQELRYRTTVNVRTDTPGAGGAAEVPAVSGQGTSVMKVVRVLPNGSAEISGSNRAQMQGMGGTTPAAGVIRFTLSPLGRMSGVQMPSASRTALIGQLMNPDALSLLPAMLPAKAVKPGEAWTSTMPNPLRGGQTLKVKSRFTRVETVMGMETARLQQYFVVPVSLQFATGQGSGMRVSGAVTVVSAANFAPEAGCVVRSALVGRGALRLVPTGPQARPSAPMTMRLKLNGTMTIIR